METGQKVREEGKIERNEGYVLTVSEKQECEGMLAIKWEENKQIKKITGKKDISARTRITLRNLIVLSLKEDDKDRAK